MTEALQKMVEAMAAEFVKQRDGDARSNWVDTDAGLQDVVLDGRFDLEAVARAGLAAISEGLAAYLSEAEQGFGPAPTPRYMLDRVMAYLRADRRSVIVEYPNVDAILEEKP